MLIRLASPQAAKLSLFLGESLKCYTSMRDLIEAPPLIDSKGKKLGAQQNQTWIIRTRHRCSTACTTTTALRNPRLNSCCTFRSWLQEPLARDGGRPCEHQRWIAWNTFQPGGGTKEVLLGQLPLPLGPLGRLRLGAHHQRETVTDPTLRYLARYRLGHIHL